ncbi:MAG: hypothetical protein K8U57_08110 [Planctomycetes bacterium]|nr:hypothetical protein [Planctomycetota bacterium]
MFLPDPTLFGDERFNPDTIRERLREYAYLNSGVRLSFTNRTTGTEDVYEFSDGIRSYVEWLNVGRQSLNPEVFITRGEAEGVQYEIGVQWCRETDDILERLYVNNLFVPVGGTPLNGLRAAVRVVVNNFILEHLPSEDQVKTNHIREGMTAVVFVRIEDPQFEGAVRGKLINPEAERVLAAGVGEFLRNEFEANPAVAEAIARHAIAAAEAEAKFREARKRKK